MLLLTALLSLQLSSTPPFAPVPAELGGTAKVVNLPAPRPSPVSVQVNLFDWPRLVTTATADLSGRYTLAAPPGDYWLQLVVGGQEVRVERVSIAPGSWPRDWNTELWV